MRAVPRLVAGLLLVLLGAMPEAAAEAGSSTARGTPGAAVATSPRDTALAAASQHVRGSGVFPVSAAPGVPLASPSADERQRLARGEVVYRVGAAPRDGAEVPGARGAIAFVRVPAAPDPVWAILMQPQRYPEIFPGLRSVDVLEQRDGVWLLRTEGKVGPFSFRYYTRYWVRPEERRLVWRLDTTRDNDVFDDNWGWWQLVPEDGATLVVYAIGSVASSWQPFAGFFERRGITQALAALREAAIRRAAAGPRSAAVR